eukprot:NODE_1294_length_918_cov_69.149178_g1248_i0.p1 GENE.NODE_1294_length_918_cov_69.149178_g1248_i0~~NODE_1294_length_918_cov_69.149178_g1248_i0.p1  ORF type:complete len:138 (-),score=14.37 NODE_1294_length_918_cov_69.149178_g1248_i0:423-836(-)
MLLLALLIAPAMARLPTGPAHMLYQSLAACQGDTSGRSYETIYTGGDFSNGCTAEACNSVATGIWQQTICPSGNPGASGVRDYASSTTPTYGIIDVFDDAACANLISITALPVENSCVPYYSGPTSGFKYMKATERL